MKPFDLTIFRQAMAAGSIEWRKHVLQKLAERGIPQDSVREVLLLGERIRDYEDDKPFPSALFLGYVSGIPLHVVCGVRRNNRTSIRHHGLQAIAGNF